jgi:hypothetical protein
MYKTVIYRVFTPKTWLKGLGFRIALDQVRHHAPPQV